MSGLGGCWHESAGMARTLATRIEKSLAPRGPDGWHRLAAGNCDLRKTVLASAPEPATEASASVRTPEGMIAIVADIRLDNRAELHARLGIREPLDHVCDDAIALAAYRQWGTDYVSRLRGDFAIAIFDEARQTLHLCRDPFGIKPLAYTQQPDFFAFASHAHHLLPAFDAFPAINPVRVADYLTGFLEAADLTSTFFTKIHRLPPGHSLHRTPAGLTVEKWFQPPHDEVLHLADDGEYLDAFMEVMERAVTSRLRGAPGLGAMLSGGLDSSTATALAARQMAAAGLAPLKTYSAVDYSNPDCNETRHVLHANTIPNIDSCLLDASEVFGRFPDLAHDCAKLAEPFDDTMVMIRAIYKAASADGLKAIIDGVGGDVVFDPGDTVRPHFRGGRLVEAWRSLTEARAAGLRSAESSPFGQFAASAWTAWAPPALRAALRTPRVRLRASRTRYALRHHLGVETNVDLASRISALNAYSATAGGMHPVEEAWLRIRHPVQVVARERYDRVAGAYGIEPRDPFFDFEVARLCARLPVEQRIRNSKAKFILRTAAHSLTHPVLGIRELRNHVGHVFVSKVIENMVDCVANQKTLVFMARCDVARSGRGNTEVCLTNLDTAHAATLRRWGAAIDWDR